MLSNEPRRMAEIGTRVSDRIAAYLAAERTRWTAIDPELGPPLDSLTDLVLAGGKRLRPAFCYWAFVGGGGDPESASVIDAGAGLELLHTFALIHDDIMDNADTRRGLPAVHSRFIAEHAVAHRRGESRRYGEAVGILVGDFAYAYSDVFMTNLPRTARDVWDELRIELSVGQYLDVFGSGGAPIDGARAERISVYKSGKYSVERPLHLGAALAGALDQLEGPLTAYGIPVGLAFQMRDDLLGVFGDPKSLGKPVGMDLREGKLTPLITETVERVRANGTPGEHALIERLIESDLADEEVVALQDLVVSCGAQQALEDRIRESVEGAIKALETAPLDPEAREALTELAAFVAWREA